MKITKNYLKQVIKEELNTMEEAGAIRDITKQTTRTASPMEKRFRLKLSSGRQIMCIVQPKKDVQGFSISPMDEKSRGSFVRAELTPEEFAEMQNLIYGKLHTDDVKGY
jgi:hypothetical protein